MVACPKQRLWERLCEAIGAAGAGGRRALRRLRGPRPEPRRARPLLARACSPRGRRQAWLERSARTASPVGRSTTSPRRSPSRRRGARGTSSPTSIPCSARFAARLRRSGSTAGAPARATGRGSVSTPARCCASCAATTKSGSARARGGRVFGTDERGRGAMSPEWRGRFLEDFASGTSTAAGSAGRSARPTTPGSLPDDEHEPDALQPRVRARGPSSASRSSSRPSRSPSSSGCRWPTPRRTPSANLGWGDIKLPKPRVRRRHALGRERGDGRARVALASLVRDRLDPYPRPQSARRGRDRVHAELHGLQGAMRPRSRMCSRRPTRPGRSARKDGARAIDGDVEIVGRGREPRDGGR